MRKKADQLKVEVHRMFETSKSMSASDVATQLVDALERLGIDRAPPGGGGGRGGQGAAALGPQLPGAPSLGVRRVQHLGRPQA
uniref:Uncharacterized protein n=1 Tax=Setaria viridis TaxID=4556 RepID=A0A4U6T771_SETVI|nr:hypothetical protein SEVIR_9G399301v2 [Setaria viridis]